MALAIDLLILFLGMGLLVWGGDLVVRGGSALARTLGISPLIVGLTVVAFGTSAPELAVNLTAAGAGQTSLSFGNIFGSNMANIGLVIGLAAIMRPLAIERAVISREIPIMIMVTLLALFMALDLSRNGSPDMYDRRDAIVLLGGFAAFLFLLMRFAARERADAEEPTEGPLLKPIGLSLLGFLFLVVGARVTIERAASIAAAMGISEVVIGLTLVAIGTSLPELATSVVATLRDEVDLAIGNVVGSNVFNVLLVAGATAFVRPIPIPRLGHVDLTLALALAIALAVVSMTNRRTIVRIEGAGLLAIYIGYLVWRSVH